MGLGEKIVAGSLSVIMIYLIVRNPNGDSAVLNSLGGAFVNGTKALQGR